MRSRARQSAVAGGAIGRGSRVRPRPRRQFATQPAQRCAASSTSYQVSSSTSGRPSARRVLASLRRPVRAPGDVWNSGHAAPSCRSRSSRHLRRGPAPRGLPVRQAAAAAYEQPRRQGRAVRIEQAHRVVPGGEKRLRRVQQRAAEALGRPVPRPVAPSARIEARTRRPASRRKILKPGRREGDIALDRRVARGQRDVLGDVPQETRAQRGGRTRRQAVEQAAS
jgi:hypothetical protein